jgi:hypothetical protein
MSVLGCGWGVGSLQEELSRDTVVLADLVGKKTDEDSFAFLHGTDSKPERLWWNIILVVQRAYSMVLHPTCFRSRTMNS